MARIVAIGGGTGLYTTLSALKLLQGNASHELMAIVSMADDGGSTGRLRDEFGVLPPGDLRRALVALSEDEGAMRKLFEYRFAKGAGLNGHSLGNLLLTALAEIYADDGAIEHAHKLLRVKGRVIPVTFDRTRLFAVLEDGTVITGETNIDVPKHDGTLRITRIALEPTPFVNEQAEDALRTADHIILGPGDLYTSLLPNLIVEGIVPALKAAKARGAKITLITNTMTKHGETNGFRASDFVRAVQEALDGARIDNVIANIGPMTHEQLAAYAQERAAPVVCDLEDQRGLRIVAEDLVGREEFARHHQGKLALALSKVIGA